MERNARPPTTAAAAPAKTVNAAESISLSFATFPGCED